MSVDPTMGPTWEHTPVVKGERDLTLEPNNSSYVILSCAFFGSEK